VASRVDSRDNIKAIAKGVVTFDGKVTKAETALTGFNFEYDEGDQNFGKEGVDISSFVVKNQVSYQVSCLFCDLDNSSSFHGSVDVPIIIMIKSACSHRGYGAKQCKQN